MQSHGNPSQKTGYRHQIQAQILDTLAVLKPYFDDVDISEIEINGPDEVFVMKAGRERALSVRLSAGTIATAMKLIAGLMDKEIGERSGNPILTARLPGFRIEGVMPPFAIKGPTMCIRRHSAQVFTLEQYIEHGVISEVRAEILRKAVRDKETFLIAGGTGSGKTTFMNTVLSLFDPQDRLFVIESVHELKLTAPNYVAIEVDEERGITPRIAVRTAMRYLPKRIILGELRGPEAFDFLDAANTGHPGSCATLHANSANQSLGRLENLLLMANKGVPFESLRAMVGESIDWMFYIERKDDKRSISQISRLHGYNRAKGEYEIESF